MLILRIERAVAAATNPKAATNGPVQHQNLANFPAPGDPIGTAVVAFNVRMYVEVDLDSEKPIQSYVLTPNVSTMHQADGLDIEHHHAGLRIPTIAPIEDLVIHILDDNEWPKPELQA